MSVPRGWWCSPTWCRPFPRFTGRDGGLPGVERNTPALPASCSGGGNVTAVQCLGVQILRTSAAELFRSGDDFALRGSRGDYGEAHGALLRKTSTRSFENLFRGPECVRSGG